MNRYEEMIKRFTNNHILDIAIPDFGINHGGILRLRFKDDESLNEARKIIEDLKYKISEHGTVNDDIIDSIYDEFDYADIEYSAIYLGDLKEEEVIDRFEKEDQSEYYNYGIFTIRSVISDIYSSDKFEIMYIVPKAKKDIAEGIYCATFESFMTDKDKNYILEPKSLMKAIENAFDKNNIFFIGKLIEGEV